MTDEEEEEVNQIPVEQDEEDDIRAAKREAMRALMEYLVAAVATSKTTHQVVAVGRKVLVAAYLLRVPPYADVGNMDQLAKRIGVRGDYVRRLATQVSVALAVSQPRKGVHRAHKRK
jgi:hypothetical protein